MKKWIILNLVITLLACGGGLIAMRFLGQSTPMSATAEGVPEVVELPVAETEPVGLSAELQAVYEERKAFYDSVAHFLEALKTRDEEALREHLSFPLKRDYPLPALETPKAVIDHLYAALSPETLNRLFTEHPVQLWEGPLKGDFMCKVGYLWLTDEVPTKVLTLPTIQPLLAEAQANEVRTLHPSLQGGSPTPVLSFMTEDGRFYGRIDQLEATDANGFDASHPYRVALYYKDTAPTAAPDAIKYCRYWTEGTAVNEFYQTKEGYFRLDVNRVGTLDMPEIDLYYPFIESDASRTVHYRAKHWTWPTP